MRISVAGIATPAGGLEVETARRIEFHDKRAQRLIHVLGLEGHNRIATSTGRLAITTLPATSTFHRRLRLQHGIESSSAISVRVRTCDSSGRQKARARQT